MKPLTPPLFAPNGAAGLLATGEDAHPAIVWHDGHVGYGALRDAVARAAAVWRAHGLRPGGRVAVRLPDGIDWVLAWLGAVWAGGVAVGSIVPRAADYLAPVCHHFGENHLPEGYRGRSRGEAAPCDLIGGCTFCDDAKVPFIDELDPTDNAAARLTQTAYAREHGLIMPEVEWAGDGIVAVTMFLPAAEAVAEAASAVRAQAAAASAEIANALSEFTLPNWRVHSSLPPRSYFRTKASRVPELACPGRVPSVKPATYTPEASTEIPLDASSPAVPNCRVQSSLPAWSTLRTRASRSPVLVWPGRVPIVKPAT